MDSAAYIAHHGVKGMKWGVRKERRKEARRIAKDLNRRDREMGEIVIYGANLKSRVRHLKRKPQTEKRAKAIASQNAAANDLAERYARLGKQQIDAVLKAADKGYAWKTTQYDFHVSSTRRIGREMVKKYGKEIKTSWFLNSSANASNRNHYTVKPEENLSDSAKERYTRKGDIYTHHPQIVRRL